jgi:hypothetical protein
MKRQFIKSLSLSLLALTISSILSIIVFELIGQEFLYKDKLYFISDIDHWNIPDGREINSDGLRCGYEAEHFREEDLNIIFLGDSYVYGWLLPMEKSLPRQFEKMARAVYPGKRINVINFGWVSSSPLLSLRLFERIGEKYKPDIVILFLDMTDFHDDIKYSRLLERRGIYRLLDLCPISILTLKQLTVMSGIDRLHEWIFGFPADRFFITNQPLEKSRRWLRYIQDSIEKINTYCENRLNAEFVLMVLPRFYQYSSRECPYNWEKGVYAILGRYGDEPFRYFDSIKSTLDYPVYSLLSDFQETTVFPTCFLDDPHWTEFGAGVAARAVLKYCRRGKVIR